MVTRRLTKKTRNGGILGLTNSGEDEDYSDDDDMSWKVRRASAKSLAALIQTYPLHLAEFYGSMGQPLVSRFREREENVKLEIFSTFGKLLRATGFALRQGDAQAEAALRALIPKIVAGLAGPLKAKSLKTRIAVFVLLKELVSVLAGALTQELKNLVSAINSALTDKSSSSALKIEVLVFLRVAFTTHSGSAIQAHVKGLLPSICGSASDSYYRISAEGLQVLARLIPLLRPLTEKTPSFDFKPYVGPIYKATLGQLQQADIDQEVKEAAVICMALVLSHFGDNLEAVPATLQILVDRMRNEITRIPAVRGMELIAASQLNIDLSSVLPAVLTELASYLRKANRTLRQASLQALDTIVGIHGAKAQSQLEEIVKALPDLIDDSDLHLSHLALRVTVAILTLAPELSPQIAELILPEAENLLRSSLLQGLALESLLAFFGAILQGKKNKAGVTYDALLQRIVAIQPSDLRRSSSGTTLMPRQVLSSVAQVVAAITKKAADKQRDATIASFMKTVGKHEDDQEVVLALLSLGEIGRRVDLAATPQIHETILAGFDAPSEDVKQSASFALGNLAVGNMSAFLPRILEEVQKNPKHQYLVLHSLREVITRQSSRKSGKKVLLEHIQPILTLLMNNMTGEEEGTRNVVAECLGKLVLASPDTILPALHSSINNESANGRATVVTSVKFAITEQPQKSDEPLRELFGQFIALIKDSNVNVRKQTLLTLNFAAHHKPDLVKPILPTYLPAIYNEAKINPALIREVDLGPFKHKVDDGLEVRKAAYQCLYTVLEHLVDMKAFVGQLVHGLSDHADIKLLCQLMLVKLSRYASSALLEGLNDIVDPLRGTITLKLKEGAVSSDVERNEEIVRSALRAVAAISRMPNVEQALKFEDLVKTCSEGEIGQKYKQALTETDEELLK